MQSIETYEIPEKLAAGWLIKRRGWHPEDLFIKAEDPFKLTKEDWAANDWEGYDPNEVEPKLFAKNLSLPQAYILLRDGAVRFIRFRYWADTRVLRNPDECCNFSSDEIVLNLWEAWK